MDVRKYFLEAATLIVAAILCALVSNAIASRERKLALVGFYPNAQKVPAQSTEPLSSLAPPAATPTATATVAMPAATSSMPAANTPMTMTIAPVTQTSTVPAAKTTSPRTTSAGTTPTPPTAAPPSPAKTATAADVLKRFPAHPDKPYVEIGFNDVNALHNAGALFLDARRTSIYEQGHIAGSRPFSVWESDVDEKVNKLFNERSAPEQQALPIVIYCSGGECEDSHMLAQKLWGIQFNNVYVYRDGFPDWQKRGGAVHTGTNP